MVKKIFITAILFYLCQSSYTQTPASTPPMGWMSWNLLADNPNEKDIHAMADALVSTGLADAGYQYIFIDDGWQGGRDNQNNMIPDANKFPSGIKALADYVHGKGLKLGIYSDAAQLTCGGYTASFGFEKQDAKTFAGWGIDYLKYDYCGAPEDSSTAKIRYKTMADALRICGRQIVFGVCEWGIRSPWHWVPGIGGHLWRMAGDVRDKWKNLDSTRHPHQAGYGILDIIDDNAPLAQYAGPGAWNDMDMLVVGMYGKEGPSSLAGGTGCTDTEYQTQMSMWCMMASPLELSNDIRNMNENTKNILFNKEIISINQDALGKQAQLKIKSDTWYVFLKPLANGEYAISVLNKTNKPQTIELKFSDIDLPGQYEIRDVWLHKNIGDAKKWKGAIQSHETKVFRLRVVMGK